MLAPGSRRKGATGEPRERGRRAENEPPFAFADVWPDDKPLPLSNAEYARLVRGHAVRWRGTLDEALRLPGRYEMVDGWLYARCT